jgi:8-oxo-dGTP diphosphatase
MHEACPNDDFVLWRDPKVVTSVVVVHGDDVVLGRRSIEPGLGLWCLPGGFVNHDEDPVDAAKRECREEIGVDIEITRLLGVYHIPKRTATSMVGVAYEARMRDGARLEPGAEMAELDSYSEGSLPELAFPSHRWILEEYFKFRASQAAAGSPRAGAAARRASRPSRARGRSTPRRTR